ncbi:MAG: Hsp20/alpha crystallin family protein [Candidatus Caldatribacteriota bacterium]|nr:Hsp20/alpha crystallin family protein [Candidatus Caldatribacteriota bacterium]
MALIQREPREVKNARDIFDDLFDFGFMPQSRVLRKRWLEGGEWSPPVDIIDKKDKIVAKAELPGVNKEDIKITFSDNILTIRGERKEEQETKKENFYCCERVQGSYSRTIALPVDIDREKITSSFKNGVLEIVLPKAKESKPKEIEIKLA